MPSHPTRVVVFFFGRGGLPRQSLLRVPEAAPERRGLKVATRRRGAKRRPKRSDTHLTAGTPHLPEIRPQPAGTSEQPQASPRTEKRAHKCEKRGRLGVGGCSSTLLAARTGLSNARAASATNRPAATHRAAARAEPRRAFERLKRATAEATRADRPRRHDTNARYKARAKWRANASSLHASPRACAAAGRHPA